MSSQMEGEEEEMESADEQLDLEELGKIKAITPRPSLTHLPKSQSVKTFTSQEHNQDQEPYLDVITELVKHTTGSPHATRPSPKRARK